MPRRHRQTRLSRKCYCDLHVVRGERIPYARWIQHQDRLWAENDLQAEEAQAGTIISGFVADHAEIIDNYEHLNAIEESPDDEVQEDDPEEQSYMPRRDDGTVFEDDLSWASRAPEDNYYEDWSDNEDNDASTCESESLDQDSDDGLSFCQFSSFESLNNVAEWKIEDERLHYAIRLAIWKIEHRVSDTAFGNRPLSRSEREDGNMSYYRVKKRLKSLTGLISGTSPMLCEQLQCFYRQD